MGGGSDAGRPVGGDDPQGGVRPPAGSRSRRRGPTARAQRSSRGAAAIGAAQDSALPFTDIEQHLDDNVDAPSDSLMFTAPTGGPLFRAWGQNVLRPAVRRAGLPGITFHGLRHSFVAIMVAAGCNVRKVSEWAGHNSVAFTLTRHGGLFEDGTDAAIDRLDALLGPMSSATIRGSTPCES
ncbi:MAG: tyrosine-type recombinase/integrase [Propionibacteriaceae bacterium]